MDNSSKPTIFYGIGAGLIWAAVGFIVGGLLAGQLIPKTDGLGGVGSFLGYAATGTFAGVFFIFMLAKFGTQKMVRLSIRWGVLLLIAMIGLLYWQNLQRDKLEQSPPAQGSLDIRPPASEPSDPGLDRQLSSTVVSDSSPAPNRSELPAEKIRGLGFADMPLSNEITRLDFYASPLAWSPTDSFLLQGERVIYAPPYLLPFYQKLDYNQLTFRWLAVGHDRVQIELNAGQGRTAWVSKDQLHLRYWPEFLVSLFAVEALDSESNPLRVKPQDNAGTLQIPEGTAYLSPQQATAEWLFLEFWAEGQGEALGEGGWLRWRNGKELLVKWDYRL